TRGSVAASLRASEIASRNWNAKIESSSRPMKFCARLLPISPRRSSAADR
ncbi:MAG: Insertion element IS401 (Burkholderia multivorans) transposase, partial [Olavius algarvensis Gamma 3 endosymbiont]